MWRRFRQHRLAVVSLWVVVAFYLVAVLAEFLAPADPGAYNPRYTYAPPQGLHFFSTDADGGLEFGPFVYGYKSEIDKAAMRRTFVIDETKKIPIEFLVPSEPYRLAGVIPMSVKLFGVARPAHAALCARRRPAGAGPAQPADPWHPHLALDRAGRAWG